MYQESERPPLISVGEGRSSYFVGIKKETSHGLPCQFYGCVDNTYLQPSLVSSRDLGSSTFSMWEQLASSDGFQKALSFLFMALVGRLVKSRFSNEQVSGIQRLILDVMLCVVSLVSFGATRGCVQALRNLQGAMLDRD